MEFKLAKLVKNGTPAIGTWMTLSDPGIIYILANAGFDWVWVDTEHNPFNETQLQAVIYAARAAGISPIVRVRKNDESLIKFALDLGAEGVVVPGIIDADDAKKAVNFARYAPLGTRGYGPIRATNFWAKKAEYNKNAAENILLICQIERESALNDVENICQVPGIDAIFIGPADLSQSMGHPGDFKHPDVVEGIKKIIETAKKYNKMWGITAAGSEEYIEYTKQGALLVTSGSDSRFMVESAAKRGTEILKALKENNLRKE